MMVAATILEEYVGSVRIFLFEKNTHCGAKVLISGGWRCNVTTGITDRKILLTKYIRGVKFLIPALNAFPPHKVVKRFEDHGVPLKCEPDNRVFPVSNNGKDIVGVFERLFKDDRIDCRFKVTVNAIMYDHDQQQFCCHTNQGDIFVDRVVVATGGNAYAHTGSAGDGYTFARQLGHEVTQLGPSLNSFLSCEDRPKRCTWISFPQSSIQFVDHHQKKQNLTWPSLFTHFGMSGPLIFALSAYVAHTIIDTHHPLTVTRKPDHSKKYEYWYQRLSTACTQHPKKLLTTLLWQIFAERFVIELLWYAGGSVYQRCADCSHSLKKSLAHALGDGMKIQFCNRRAWDEFVTAWWVVTSQIDPKTMQSLLRPWLYRVGEVLDVDGLTWWFNLQSSRATGRLAGRHIVSQLSAQQPVV